MKRPYRAGIIGLGRIGFSLGGDKLREQPASHARAFAESPFFELDGGCDPDAHRREDFLRRFPRARSYAHAEEMMSDLHWDTLVIATPEDTHLQVFREIAHSSENAADKPRLVVLEKPVAPNLEDSLEIEKIAMDHGIPVMVNHERRFSRDWLYAKSLVESGELGELLLATGHVLTRTAAWYPGDETRARGALLHDACHMADCLAFVSGGTLSVESAEHTGRDAKGAIRGVSFSGKVGEAVYRVNAGYGSRAFVFEAEFVFQNGRLRIGNGVLSLERAKKSPFYEGFQSLAVDGAIKPMRETGYFSGMVQAAAEYLAGKAPLRSTLADGVAAMRVLSEAMAIFGNPFDKDGEKK